MKTDSSFDVWWHNEGSGMPPLPGEDAETHVRRICEIAWKSGQAMSAIEQQLKVKALSGALNLAKQHIAGEFGFENWRIEQVRKLERGDNETSKET